ncbi:hypothetical protein DTO021C3_1072 [Paecilomyces variotii]|nr:hypothetical protein DTO021C3_1072 [Paecilomyces variotii]
MSDLLTYILTHEDAFRKNRLPSLYSDFALQKSTNPDGYAVNVAAWEHALTNAARAGQLSSSRSTLGSGGGGERQRKKTDHIVLRADETLLRELESPEWGRPVALASVFDEAIQKRSMVPLQLYKTSGASLQKKQWQLIDPGMLSPWNVMSWGIKQLRGIVVGSDSLESSPRLQAQELVLVENLKEAASRVTKQALSLSSSKVDLIYSRESFVNEFSTVMDDTTELSEADFDVLLIYLSRDSNSIVYDGKTVKFKSGNDTSAQITQQDTTVASIKTLISSLSKQVSNLEGKINELNNTAKVALNNKNRLSALSALRSKKLAEQNLKQRSDTLAQLEEIYTKIEQAADQVEIVRVMEASTGVLRGLHAQVGGVEKVEDVVEELREEMSKVDEVGNILNEAGPVIDEGEIDEELEALENQELQAKEEKEAEKTRNRLAELDSIQQTAEEAARKAEAEQGDIASDLAESIGKLSHMSIEDRSEQPLESK